MAKLPILVWLAVGYEMTDTQHVVKIIQIADTLAHALEIATSGRYENYAIEIFEISDEEIFRKQFVSWFVRVSEAPQDYATIVAANVMYKVKGRIWEIQQAQTYNPNF